MGFRVPVWVWVVGIGFGFGVGFGVGVGIRVWVCGLGTGLGFGIVFRVCFLVSGFELSVFLVKVLYIQDESFNFVCSPFDVVKSANPWFTSVLAVKPFHVSPVCVSFFSILFNASLTLVLLLSHNTGIRPVHEH